MIFVIFLTNDNARLKNGVHEVIARRPQVVSREERVRNRVQQRRAREQDRRQPARRRTKKFSIKFGDAVKGRGRRCA